MPRHVHPTPFILQPPADLVTQHPALRQLSQALSHKYASRELVTEDHLQAMGAALWYALDVQTAFDTAHRAAGAAVLALVVESASAEVQALPWETLYHPTLGFLGRHPGFTLSRRVVAAGLPAAPPKGPLRVLLFTLLPDDVDPERGRLNVEEEQVQVQEALLPWIAEGRVVLAMPDDGRLATLQALLAQFQPHLLFLSGHGRFHHEPHSGAAPYGELFFEDDAGRGVGVREDTLAQALVGMGTQAVVVSACESSKAASVALTNGLAQHLSACGLPLVVGMRESLLDPAGIAFARALCDALAQRERMDVALQMARRAMQTPLKDSVLVDGVAAELSLGQWCLPMLLAPHPQQPLIDWDFAPRTPETHTLNQRLETVSLPTRFVGRRAELRRHQQPLLAATGYKLLITGPGGQGKTALAGKLALHAQAQGYRVFAYSARPENPWRDFELDVKFALDEARAKKYERICLEEARPAERARWLLRLLLEQFNGRVLFFFDNLESVQDPDSLALKDETLAAWVQAALTLPALALLATSRWQLPGWAHEHLLLEHASYGDFLQLAHQLALRGQLPKRWLTQRDRLRQVYAALGGNCRGLEFFAAAVVPMADDAEEAFLAQLAQTQHDLQTDMALDALYAHLPAPAQTLLARLPAYTAPVPAEGLLKLGLDLPPDPQPLLERLLAVSLLEAEHAPAWAVVQYQVVPLVADWLRAKGLADEASAWRNAAADYHLYLFKYERRTVSQAIATHHALRRAARHPEADRLALANIVYPLTLAGLYTTLLAEWLPPICQSEDPATRAEALGQTGKVLHHIGNYARALDYMQQALALQQQIGDKEGEGTTLNNLSQIYQAQGDYATALTYLQQALAICQQLGDRAGEGATLNNLSQIYDAQGDYATALTYLQQALVITQQLGNRAGEGATLNNLATLAHAQGDYATALPYLQQALAIRRAIGDQAGEGATLNNLSQIYDAQGDYATALTYLQQALAIQQQLGDRAGLCATLFNMGHLYAQNEQIQEAVSAWVTVYGIAKEIGEAQALQALAQLAPQLGLPEGLSGWERLSAPQRGADFTDGADGAVE